MWGGTPSSSGIRCWNGVTLLGVFVAIFLAQEALWEHARTPTNTGAAVWQGLAFGWVLAIVPASVGIVGLLTFARPEALVLPVANLVCWRFVSRGDHADVLASSVASVQREMAAQPLFPFVIEIVSERDLSHRIPETAGLQLAPPGYRCVRHLLVPSGYRTPNGSRHKARALHYATTASPIPDSAWIVHMDEESHCTPSLVRGVAQAVREEERSGCHRIGQGVILYHRGRERHPVLTLADSIRTGDDYGRFAFASRLGYAVFGFHGSFILVRNDVAKGVGFDFGPHGSITEDAWWILVQLERGRRCRFVDGYVVEQSPQSARDFVLQRRRWFLGLVQVVRRAPVRRALRAPLGALVAIWSVSWLVNLYTVANLAVGYREPLWLRVPANVVFAYFVSLYVIGLRMNLLDRPASRARSIGFYAAQVLLVPFYAMLESASVLWALLHPSLGFHVVRKDPVRPASARPLPIRPALIRPAAEPAPAATR